MYLENPYFLLRLCLLNPELKESCLLSTIYHFTRGYLYHLTNIFFPSLFLVEINFLMCLINSVEKRNLV